MDFFDRLHRNNPADTLGRLAYQNGSRLRAMGASQIPSTMPPMVRHTLPISRQKRHWSARVDGTSPELGPELVEPDSGHERASEEQSSERRAALPLGGRPCLANVPTRNARDRFFDSETESSFWSKPTARPSRENLPSHRSFVPVSSHGRWSTTGFVTLVPRSGPWSMIGNVGWRWLHYASR